MRERNQYECKGCGELYTDYADTNNSYCCNACAEEGKKADFERITRQIDTLEKRHGKYAVMTTENECELRELSSLKQEANRLAGIKIY